MKRENTEISAQLSALVGSRICHDLISPLGAISNGIELLEMSNLADTPEVQLIAESIANANARILFFRVAFGSSTETQRINQSEINQTLGAIAAGARVQYRWQAAGDHSRPDVRILFLLILCIESAMAFGGEITVQSVDGKWRICGEADKLKIDQALWDTLSAPSSQAAKIPASAVHFALVTEHCRAADRRLMVDLTDQKIRIEF